MDEKYWHKRWEEGQISGFHQQEANPHLIAFWSRLGVVPGDRVLVPMCGKSRDMLWLHRQGFETLGAEIVASAVESFFEENDVPVQTQQAGAFTAYRSEGVTILCGDFFDLTVAEVGNCAAVYDRASLIALPPDLRARYASHLLSLFPRGLNSLLITLEYPQHEMEGPPFSVSEQEVQALYGKHCSIERLLVREVLDENPQFRDRGLTRLEEKVYLLSPIQ
jgi:thiopurine S-methyltransferase